MKNVRKNLTLTLAFVLILSLAMFSGCSKPTVAPPVATETPPVVAADTEEKMSDTMLIWNIGSEPGSWDPQLAGTVDGSHIINNMFEGLMSDTQDGIIYGAAESYEITANADGVEDTIYTFKLKKGLKWSDSQPLTAQDFVSSWIRAIEPVTAASYAFLFTDFVVGADEYYNGEGAIEDIKINALDELTLQIELKNPTPYFLNLTAFTTFMPTRADVVEGTGEGWEKTVDTAISNGPFKMSEYAIGSHITLVKNENYWDADKVKLAGIKCLMINEGTTALQGYQAGDINILSTIPQEEIPRLIAEDPNFTTEPAMGGMFYSFNVDVEPTNNVDVRKALSLAIDRKAIVEQVLRGGQSPAASYVPPSFVKSDGISFRKLDNFGNVVEEFGIDPWNVNVAKAKEHLALAGYPDGKGFPTLELFHNVSENDKKVAEAIQQMWKQNLGIDVTLRSEEWRVFTSSRYEGNFVVCRGGWSGDYNDPMTMFDLFTSRGINYSQWRWQPYADRESDTTLNPANKDYEDQLKLAMTTTGKTRDEHLANAEKIFMDDAVVAPIYYNASTYIIDAAKVEDIGRSPMGSWIFKDAKMID